MGVSTKVFVNFKDFSQANMHIVKDFIDLNCDDEAKEILQGFSKYLKDKLIDCCDIMIVYVPNDCESNSDNIVVKDFN